ncbi:CaiB/BaiF CoA transferase family protein [Streptomyces sp. NPDC091292]|uniref:CaiB/BaiF CoA transferase family protein n=1 Tax=Streptomyces sp. NPDC091292 TaxID=3365991 RepID=UPI0037F1E4B2
MAETSAHGPLQGVRVLDLSWGIAGPITTMLLADSGADVTRIESPHGDPVRDEVAYRVWNRGKRSAVVDLTDPLQRWAFMRQAATADVLVESFEPGVTARLGIDAAQLSVLNPRLIHCSITGYGPDGPDAHRPALDSLVAARTGLQWDQRGRTGTSLTLIAGAPVPLDGLDVPELPASRLAQEGPAFLRSTWASLGAAYLAGVGIAGALRAREVTGRGEQVSTSLLQGAMAAAGPTWMRAEHVDAPGFWMWVTDRRAPEGLFECADGRWIHFWTIRPTLVLEAAEADVLPIEGEKDDMRSGVRIGMEAEDLVVLHHYHPLLAAAFRKFPSDQWMAFGAARNLGIMRVRSPEEALNDQALLDQGCVVESVDPQVGPIRHVGKLLEFSASPAAVRGPAPRLGGHTRDFLTVSPGPAAETGPHTGGALDGPLAGITVLDLGLGVAGPWGARVLADLGATVIKVHAPHDGYWTRTSMAMATNWGKRSIAVDLKSAEGRELLEQLISRADVLAHNMRPGAAERLGIGYEQLRERYPALIYSHTRGFEDGPRSLLPGTDQTANALAGTEYEDGACATGAPPVWSRVNVGDTGNGFLWATAVMQALYHRERTGLGQRVGTSIINACLLTTSFAYARVDGEPVDRPRVDARQRGLSALHGLYRLADDEWACIAVLREREWPELCAALGAPDLVQDQRFGTSPARRTHDGELRAELEPLFARLSTAELGEAFDKRHLPYEISSRTFAAELFDDPEIARRSWIASAQVPGVGLLEQPARLVEFARHVPPAVSGPCQAGQHTREILAELGLPQDEINRLIEQRVVVAQ